MSDLKDRIALVTGASGAIGGAIALALAREGARLVVVGRDRDRLADLGEACRKLSPEVDPHVTDLTDEARLRRLAGRVQATFGGVDVLVHGAGAFAAGALAEAPVEDLDRQWATNVRAPYLLTQLLLPGLRSRRGDVVFINSSAGRRSRAMVGAYAASKFALRALADALREEEGPAGVRVLTVYPGRTASAMQARVRAFEGQAYDPADFMPPEDVAEAVLGALRLPSTATLTELTLLPARPLG